MLSCGKKPSKFCAVKSMKNPCLLAIWTALKHKNKCIMEVHRNYQLVCSIFSIRDNHSCYHDNFSCYNNNQNIRGYGYIPCTLVTCYRLQFFYHNNYFRLLHRI